MVGRRIPIILLVSHRFPTNAKPPLIVLSPIVIPIRGFLVVLVVIRVLPKTTTVVRG